MISLKDNRTWPEIGSNWRHYNGNIYEVLMFTNIISENQDKYPTTIVYYNIENMANYSRPLMDWERSMTAV